MAQLTARINPLLSFFRPPPPAFDRTPAAPRRAVAEKPERPVSGASREDCVRQAFKDMPLEPREKKAIEALLSAPGSTALELSRTCGWMDTGWRTQMLLLCQRRRHYLWPDGLGADTTNGIIITALAEYDPYALQFRPRRELAGILRAAVTATD